jgi:1,4-alpha-glucan branching enzyme
MGWMHDTLAYVERDPVHRRWHQSELTFRSVYAFTENFVLPLSHDEVVHGKSSLLGKMPGDEWQRFANLRLLIGYQYTSPGKKLLFMGSEFGQLSEWNHEASLDWHLMDRPFNAGTYRWIRDLNHAYRENGALHERDCDPSGFEMRKADPDSGLVCYLRRGSDEDVALVLCNFTPVPRSDVEIEVPSGGFFEEILNSDAVDYGGGGIGNLGGVRAEGGRDGSPGIVRLTAPPLGCVVLRRKSHL